MNLLIITQKVDKNDAILGFFHRWIEEFSKNVESVVVICLYKGSYSLPENVKVLSLGKEFKQSRTKYLFRFYKFIWQERNNYDNVFVHMNQVYVLLGGLVWKMFKKQVGLWYVHKAVSLSLRLAVKMADHVFSVAKESFRVNTTKLNIVGHGIDTEVFNENGRVSTNSTLTLLSVGRIAPVKNIDLIIDVVKNLNDKKIKTSLEIAGEAIYTSDKKYFEYLKSKIKKLNLENQITFLGKVTNEDTAFLYKKTNIFINLSDTGGVDKVVLEAMACGTKVVTSNVAFENILDKKYRTTKNLEEIADKIINLKEAPNDPALAEYVSKNHNIKLLIPKILDVYTKN